MNYATKSKRKQILVWCMWAVACLIFVLMPEQVVICDGPEDGLPAIAGVVAHDGRNGSLFPWQIRRRWRKWAWQRHCELRRAHQRAVWIARLARLALTGALTLAQLVDLVTHSQLRRRLGALPVLYALLEELRVREIIMLALLAYSLLERQVRHGGLQMTTRRIIHKLPSLDVIETCCWDGSRLLRLVPVDDEQAALLHCLAHILAQLCLPRWPHPALPAGEAPVLALPPPS